MNVFRKGKMYVRASRCATCIFHKGNLMSLHPGRVKQMVAEATRKESCIPCHESKPRHGAVCHGFFTKYATRGLQIAERLGFIEWVK